MIAAQPRRPPLAALSAAGIPNWLSFLIRRLLAAVVVLFVASLMVFAAIQVLPGNSASVVLGRNASPDAVAALTHKMGLSQPWIERYFDWLGNFVTGDLGNSVVGLAQGAKSAPISKLIDGPIVNSIALAAIAGACMVIVSLSLGVLAAVRAGRITDHAINDVTLAAISLPEFVLGSLLIVLFFVNLGLFSPVALVPPGKSPLDHPSILVLPVLTLLGASCASGIRMVRTGMLGELRSEYVETARLNGLSEPQVIRYALRNALAPSVQIFAQNLQWLIGGIIITENLFAYPGLGMELVNAVNNRDVTVVQSTVMLIAIVYVLLNILADLLVMLLVPRLREP